MKKIIWIIIIIAIIVIGLVWHANSPSTDTTSTPVVDTSAPAGLTTSSSDTSNTALQADLSSIDTQLTGLNSDSANADASLNASATQ